VAALSEPLSFHPLDEATARQITTWRYDGIYAAYDMGNDDEEPHISDLVGAASPYFAVRDATGDLSGFCCFGSSALVWDVPVPFISDADGNIPLGLGMRPDLTGHGFGLAFIQAVMTFAQAVYHPQGFVLYVMPFNQRAITVYERAGFTANRMLAVPYGEFNGDAARKR
jgi:[ribosomal protein S18]-alanine N-acetyltransferase